MFCIAYVLQFVHEKILQRLKASEVSLCSVGKFDSYLRRSAVRKNRRSTRPFSTPGRCLSVGDCLGPVTHSCVLRGASTAHEMHDQANDGHNEEQVNQPARNVECEKAHKPSYQ